MWAQGDTILTSDAQQRSLEGKVRKRERDGCLCDFMSGGSDIVPVQSLALLRKGSGQDNAWPAAKIALVPKPSSSGQGIRIGSTRHPWFVNSACIAADLREHCGGKRPSLVRIETWTRRSVVIGLAVFGAAAPLNLDMIGLIAMGGVVLLILFVFPATLKRIFLEHLRRELHCEKADPDSPKDELLRRPANYFRGGEIAQLQDALNRHWAYHARQAAAAGIQVETGPTNWMRDFFKPVLVGLAVMAGIASVIWCVQHLFSYAHAVLTR
jgi:hypothetical protein